MESVRYEELKLVLYNELPAVLYKGEWYYWKINCGGEYLEKAENPDSGQIKYRIEFHRFF